MKLLKAALSVCIFFTAFPVSAQIAPNFRGDFQSELRFSGGQGPAAIAIGDVNGDGKPDLVVADYDGDAVSVLLGNGDGTFGSPTSYPVGAYPDAVALADLNGDGHLDIVCVSLNLNHLTLGGTVSVLLGKGDGTFASAVNHVVGKNLASVVLADFNADGHIDIATSDVASGNVAVLLNKGDGTFQPAVPYPAGPNPLSLGAADFNGDGKIDLVVTNFCDVSQDNFGCTSQQTTVTVLLGHGDGTFGSPVSYPAGTSPFHLIVGDFNADGKNDIAVSHGAETAASISVLLGNGDGTFQAPASYPAGGSWFAAGDFNGDGAMDLIVGSQRGLVELLGTGTGAFYAAVRYFVPLSFGGISPVAVGDLNGDGRPDVVIPAGQDVIDVFLNAGGTTRQATSISLSSSQNPVQALSQSPPLTVTASVMPAGASLQGSVTFYVDGQALLSADQVGLNSSNQATCCSLLTSGTHVIAAIYSGDTATQGSTTSPLTQTVTAIPTNTSLSSTPNPSLTGQSVTFTAQVSGGGGPSNGSVTFFDGTTPLGTVPVTPSPIHNTSPATLTVSNLTVGTHSITAAYGNSAYFAPSVSSVLQQVVNVNLNLTVAAGSQGSATVPAGQTAQFTLTIGGAGFSGQTTVTCTGVPAGATCSVMPASLMVSATSPSTLNLNVTTTSRTSALLVPQGVISPWMWAVILIGFVALPRRVRGVRPDTTLFLVSLFLVALLVGSCGGGSSSSETATANGTPAGTYTITVKATSGTAAESVSLTLTVQ
jgi:hypothetical protein